MPESPRSSATQADDGSVPVAKSRFRALLQTVKTAQAGEGRAVPESSGSRVAPSPSRGKRFKKSIFSRSPRLSGVGGEASGRGIMSWMRSRSKSAADFEGSCACSCGEDGSAPSSRRKDAFAAVVQHGDPSARGGFSHVTPSSFGVGLDRKESSWSQLDEDTVGPLEEIKPWNDTSSRLRREGPTAKDASSSGLQCVPGQTTAGSAEEVSMTRKSMSIDL